MATTTWSRVARWTITLIAVAATIYVLLPFDIGPPVSCGSALVEAWPESGTGGGWFNYAPNDDSAFFPPGVHSSLCGAEARQRIAIPLMLGSLGGLAFVGSLHWRRRAAPSTGDGTDSTP